MVGSYSGIGWGVLMFTPWRVSIVRNGRVFNMTVLDPDGETLESMSRVILNQFAAFESATISGESGVVCVPSEPQKNREPRVQTRAYGT